MSNYLSYLMYLRKSRQDDPNETVEEVLAKHEAILQEYAMREMGGKIPEKNIYREVISGESIDEREEIKKVLSRIEEQDIAGVLVVEPQRLSRGDLVDCGTLIRILQYTATTVVTPVMTYNLENKMERKFFQDELLRGRDYLEYTKEILMRGRLAAVKRGCFISSVAPYGYDRVKIGRDWTLAPNENADVVKLIFEWYVKEDLSIRAVARRLNEQGFPRARDASKWNADVVREILNNDHYAGKVRFNYSKEVYTVENGKRVSRIQRQSGDKVTIVEGKHEAIVPPELFAAAKKRLRNNPHTSTDENFHNVLAGLIRCKECGKTLALKNTGNNTRRYLCRNSAPQHYKSVPEDKVINSLIYSLEHIIIPEIEAKIKNGDGNSAEIQKKRLEKLSKQMEEYRKQEDYQYELLETKQYTQEVFNKRNDALRKKIEACEKEIHQTKAQLPKNINYEDKLLEIKEAIIALKHPTMPVKVKNRILRSVIDHIEFSAVDLGRCKGAEISLMVRIRF